MRPRDLAAPDGNQAEGSVWAVRRLRHAAGRWRMWWQASAEVQDLTTDYAREDRILDQAVLSTAVGPWMLSEHLRRRIRERRLRRRTGPRTPR